MKAHQLAGGQRVVEPAVLGEEANACARRAAADRLAEHLGVALVGRDEGQQHLDRRGLAGAVRSEEAEDLSGIDGERQVIDGKRLAKRLAEPAGVDDASGHWREFAIASTSLKRIVERMA